MNAHSVSGSAVQQTLLVHVPIRDGEEPALERELERREAALLTGLKAASRVHSARLFVLPGARGAPAALVLETRFDGPASEHRSELREAVGDALLALFAHGEGPPRGPGELDGWLIERGRRLEATCSGHAGLSRATIANDARLDAAVQGFLDAEQAAGRLAGATELTLAQALQRLARERDIPLFRLQSAEETRTTLADLARRRPFATARTVAAAPLLVLADRIRRRREGARGNEGAAPVTGAGQNALIHEVPLRPGERRRSAVRFALYCVHELARSRGLAHPPEPLRRIHCAAWALLPNDRLLFTMTHDGNFEVLGPELAKSAARAIRAIWGHTEGFAAASCVPTARGLGIDGLRRFARVFEVRAQIWYSAYPELTVADVLRNHHLRELLAGDLDAASASALCALL